MLTQSAILNREGWTKTLLARLLGEPDEVRKAAGYPHPLKLYALERVESTEASEAFRSAQAKTAKRKASAEKGVKTKTRRLVEMAEAMPIAVARIPDLTARAISDYNDHRLQRGDYHQIASPASDRAFLDRIAVNYARHQLTEYDEHLEQLATKTGVRAALSIIRARVYASIAEAYPTLSSECQRQSTERGASHD